MEEKRVNITDCIGMFIVMDNKIVEMNGYNYKDDTVIIYVEKAHPSKSKEVEMVIPFDDDGRCMIDEDKVVFDTNSHENLQFALLGVFDSQISGGKRYDLATMGRRRSNAVYFESHNVDTMDGMVTGMDLTPLIKDPTLDILQFVQHHIQRFSDEVQQIIKNIQ